MQNRIKDRSIMIYGSENDVNINKKTTLGKCIDMILTKNKNIPKTQHIYSLYNGDVYSPPFFKHIYYMRNDITLDTFQLLWNMLLINGIVSIYIYKKNKFLDKLPSNNDIHSEIKGDFIIIKKKNNSIYTFKEYRTLDFIIPGVMKSGSTAALQNLSMHPDIYMPNDEVHYFDNLNRYGSGKYEFLRQFDFKYKLVGLKTSCAIYYPISHQLMQHTNPYMKIIIFLRDPCERAYSHYKMMVSDFGLKSSFEECIDDELTNRMDEPKRYFIGLWHDYIKRGFYYEQIWNLLRYFPVQNILVLITEHVKKDMTGEYNKIYDFLNLPKFEPKTPYQMVFMSKDSRTLKEVDIKMYNKLKKIFSSDVHKLEKLLGYKTGWW